MTIESAQPLLERRPVESCSTFARSVADVGLAINLGRDVEIAFLQASPRIAAILSPDGADDQQGFDVQGSLIEVARIRMAPAAAMIMATMTMEVLIKAGRVKTDELLKSLSAIMPDSDAADLEKA